MCTSKQVQIYSIKYNTHSRFKFSFRIKQLRIKHTLLIIPHLQNKDGRLPIIIVPCSVSLAIRYDLLTFTQRSDQLISKSSAKSIKISIHNSVKTVSYKKQKQNKKKTCILWKTHLFPFVMLRFPLQSLSAK